MESNNLETEAIRPLLGLFPTRSAPQRKPEPPKLTIDGVAPAVVADINMCLKEIRKKQPDFYTRGALNDLIVAMVLKKNSIDHRLVYGILLKEKITILTVAVMMGDELVGWPGFRMQPFVSMQDKTTMIDFLEMENSPFLNPEGSLKSLLLTFDQAIELNQEIVIPKENYEKLRAAYVDDHAITRVLKRLKRDGKL